MRIVLLFLALGITIIALRIISALKTVHSTRKEFDQAKTAAASAGQAVSSSGTAHALPGAGALEDRKTSLEEKTVPANTGGPLSGADARGGTGIGAAAPPAVSSGTDREKSERKEMWVDSHYCWVVLCKNHWFHLRQNLFFRHRIPLAETDPVAPRPSLDGHFSVRCDDCRKEYSYKPSDVLKYEQELPDSFTPHPLFRNC
ncbi:MAG: hypothetical protein DMG90_00445 [Acidobacteria bacterium]|nr:MAG: hypothetical protein DMG90_00445 [Acidobacteriota bacterium]